MERFQESNIRTVFGLARGVAAQCREKVPHTDMWLMFLNFEYITECYTLTMRNAGLKKIYQFAGKRRLKYGLLATYRSFCW